MNLREQHDAYEFFNSLVDSIDEGLKSLGLTPIISKVLGGTFADQKICKGCPHRYSREEPFTALNVDIRNHQNLQESLEQYVKGDLLEGANAYYCDKCSQKVRFYTVHAVLLTRCYTYWIVGKLGEGGRITLVSTITDFYGCWLNVMYMKVVCLCHRWTQ